MEKRVRACNKQGSVLEVGEVRLPGVGKEEEKSKKQRRGEGRERRSCELILIPCLRYGGKRQAGRRQSGGRGKAKGALPLLPLPSHVIFYDEILLYTTV